MSWVLLGGQPEAVPGDQSIAEIDQLLHDGQVIQPYEWPETGTERDGMDDEREWRRTRLERSAGPRP